jgi:hypothetical protein
MRENEEKKMKGSDKAKKIRSRSYREGNMRAVPRPGPGAGREGRPP